jgi:hypothetical protein
LGKRDQVHWPLEFVRRAAYTFEMDSSDQNTGTVGKDRKLGDEWLDWDGRVESDTADAPHRLFLGLAVLSAVVLVILAGLFLWLIHPRLAETGNLLPRIFSYGFLTFAAIVILWTAAFAISAARGHPLAPGLTNPRIINKLLSLATGIGRIAGISPDRLTNSFLKIHNAIAHAQPRTVRPDRLLVLAPRCLTRENNRKLRAFRDTYGFQMAVVGGGSQARLKIRETQPELIIAIACERDLLSGFKEVNLHIPVIGFPNKRPEGPCKNTCIDISQIEDAIKDALGYRPGEAAESG